MKILYLCQSNTLELFTNISNSLRKEFETNSAYIILTQNFMKNL